VFVVHGLVTAGGRPAYWAEGMPAARLGRRRSTRRAEPHPFAVAPPVAGTAGSAVLTLPSVGSAPVGSPELGLRRPGRGAERALPWSVPLVFPPPTADPETAIGDARAGASVGYLTDVAWFAADLVGRGRVLPAIVVAGGAFEGRWRAVLTGDDAHRFEALHRAMPGVARSATPDLPADEVTRAAIDHIADAIVRERLARRARETYEARFGPERLVAALGEVYAELEARVSS